MTATRRAHILQVLAAAPGGLTMPLIIQGVPSDCEPNRSATLYDSALRQLAAGGEVEVAGKKRGGHRGPGRNVWRITRTGLEQVRQQSAAPAAGERLDRDTPPTPGPGTPGARRQAVADLRAQGCPVCQAAAAAVVSDGAAHPDPRVQDDVPGAAAQRRNFRRSNSATTANRRPIPAATVLSPGSVQQAVHVLATAGATLPATWAEAALLRAQHPADSLAALAAMTSTPCTKDALADRLRGIITAATRTREHARLARHVTAPP